MAFWNIVNAVIDKSDVVIEVLDARFPDMTRNPEIETKVLRKGKKLLLVINKSDLINKEITEKIKKRLSKIAPVVFIAAKQHLGTTYLREGIMKLSKGESVVVGILGYPNTGKSSVINSLKGREAAKSSSMSGYTKGKQLVRISKKIIMLDTPGVYSYKENDVETLAIFGAVDYTKLKEPDLAAIKLLEMFPEIVSSHYKLEIEDPNDMLEKLAKKMNKLKKGGLLDINSAAKELMKDWQKARIVFK